MIYNKWTLKSVTSLHPRIKFMRKVLKNSGEIKEKRLLEKEIGVLAKSHKDFRIHMTEIKGNNAGGDNYRPIPAVGLAIAELSEINEETVCECLTFLSTQKELTSMDVESFCWQAKFVVLDKAFAAIDSETLATSGDYGECGAKLGALTLLDTEKICREFNPLDRVYAEDTLYQELTSETKSLYRKMTAEIADACVNNRGRGGRNQRKLSVTIKGGVNESRLSREYVNLARTKNRHIGEVITSDYYKLFPLSSPSQYISELFFYTLILTLLVCASVWFLSDGTLRLRSAFGLSPLLFLPAFAVVKPILDLSVSRALSKKVKARIPLPQVDLKGEIPSNAKTLCVISTLLTSPEDVTPLIKKLDLARLKNSKNGFSPNLCFAALCDFKANKVSPDDTADEKITEAVREAFTRAGYVALIRNREYSKTSRCYQGRERKRGAIESLMKLLRIGDFPQSRSDFSEIIGDFSALTDIRYIVALDYDTVPLMDSISELVGIAMHPCHKQIGIIAPRITTSLASSLKTGFSRAMVGNGGCAGVSSYDSFAGEFYQDCFSEGIFTGKGLLDVDTFLKTCCSEHFRFPNERILSHDILEGGLCGVVYAGDVEFSDSFPDTSNAYFKRLHRWLRGDLQNARYMFDRRFTALTRFKLFDNVRRALTPISLLLCFFVFLLPLYTGGNIFFVQLLALAAVILPFLTGFLPSMVRGRKFSNYRRFYSPVLSQTKQLMRQCLMEVLLLPKQALVALDALCRVLWRMNISKRKLLDWTTAAAFDGKFSKGAFGATKHMFWATLVAIALFALAATSGNVFSVVMSVLFLSALPVILYCDKTSGHAKYRIPEIVRKELGNNAHQIWQFYEDYVTEEHNFLPPDNVQYSPIERVAARTSPTNIGMYLLSCVAAYIFGFIDKAGLELRVGRTLETIERLDKWHGNLCNWYTTDNLDVISEFVSSVDSGNYVCCLVALVEALKHEDCEPQLILRLQKQIDETELVPFYNEAKNLFSIGYDMNAKKLSHHHYDLLMSEARMLSYYAIASGQASKKHWRNLGRVMGKKGKYAAPVAWTGTMFEYFMPELLLSSKEGSMEYEALKFCLHCQVQHSEQGMVSYSDNNSKARGNVSRTKSTNVPFGISESGFYAFDRNLNYQYKAHGVQDIGLKAGLNKEYVVSPYSTFLALSYDPIGCYNNLAKMEKLGLCHERYGFYEAADFTPHRVGSGYAVVKSHMAHHMGMSICAIANTLYDGIMQKLFITNEKMKRAGELMEEKIIAGEPVLAPPERQEEREMRMNADILASGFSLSNPRLNVLSNGQVSVITSDLGFSQTLFNVDKNANAYNSKAALFPTCDLYNPRGSLYAFVENAGDSPNSGESVYAFYNHPKLAAKKANSVQESDNCVIFTQNTSEYLCYAKDLKMRCDVFLDEARPVEIRSFTAENNSGFKRNLTLSAYLEPTLSKERDVLAHPAFMDLFVKLSYNEDEKLFIAKRKSRDSNDETVMVTGFAEPIDLTYSFDREAVIARNGGIFSSLDKAGERSNSSIDVPAPCILIKADFALDANQTKTAFMFTCYAESVDEALRLARETRAKHKSHKLEPSEDISSPLVSNTIYGRITRRVLGKILYAPQSTILQKKAVSANDLDYRVLWKYGISGDIPILVYAPDIQDKSGKLNGIDAVIEMKKSLSLCQIEFDLVLLYENEKQRTLYEELRGEINTDAYILDRNTLPTHDLNLLYAAAALVLNSSEVLRFDPPANGKAGKPMASVVLPLNKAMRVKQTSPVAAGNYVCEERSDYGLPPWSNVLCNSRFGTLVSDKSLGFTWALNSRECKLTPWSNDLRSDNRGEMLVLKTKGVDGELFDLIDGSRATFAPNAADYSGIVANSIQADTSVRVYERGMGKRVTLQLTNHTDVVKQIEIAYYTEPVIGVERTPTSIAARLLKPEVSDNTLIIRNPSNGSLSGAMTLSCSAKARFLTNKSAFWSGDWRAVSSPTPHSNMVGVVVTKIELPPKHSEKIKFILAFTQNMNEPLTMEKALKRKKGIIALKSKEINSGNPQLDELFAHWLPWQVVGGRMWSRTGFYQNSGAYGFRDQLQDCLAAVILGKRGQLVAKTQILRCCTAQFLEGDVMHWWHDLLTSRKGVRTRYSDDLLWLPYVVADYIELTGDTSLLQIKTHYSTAPLLKEHEHEIYSEVEHSELKESVYQHAKRALEKAFNQSDRGLLLIGGGDWCDGYNRVGVDGKGESVWLSMFYAMTARKFAKIAELMDDVAFGVELEGNASDLIEKVDQLAWDGEHYLRAFYDDGTAMGGYTEGSENQNTPAPACKIDLLPQAFSVLAKMPDSARVNQAINSALRDLYDSEHRIIKLFSPPFQSGESPKDPGYVQSYPAGVRENGGQYTHAAVWLALACHRLGMKEKAKELIASLSPAGRGKEYKCEPYYLAADIYTNPKAYARGGWSLYTGSAGWYYRAMAEIFAE